MPVDMKRFFRYPEGNRKLPQGRSIMKLFTTLENIRRLSRVGGICTASMIAKQTCSTTYLSRKLLHECHDLGLVDWEVKEHRPGVDKRIYKLTDRGLAVVNAYYDGVLWDGGC